MAMGRVYAGVPLNRFYLGCVAPSRVVHFDFSQDLYLKL